MKKDIILIGGGGHCKACIEVIEADNKFKIVGIVDIKEKAGKKVLGYEIFASDEDIPRLANKYKNFLITIGQIKSSKKRERLFTTLKNLGLNLPAIISPSSLVSKRAEIGEGTIVLHGVYINSGARIGRNCIINTNAVVEHDSLIGDHCHLSMGSIVTGGCSIGEGVFIGSNSVVANNLSIANNTIIGAGSVVIKSLIESGTYVGNPAKKLDNNE